MMPVDRLARHEQRPGTDRRKSPRLQQAEEEAKLEPPRRENYRNVEDFESDLSKYAGRGEENRKPYIDPEKDEHPDLPGDA